MPGATPTIRESLKSVLEGLPGKVVAPGRTSILSTGYIKQFHPLVSESADLLEIEVIGNIDRLEYLADTFVEAGRELLRRSAEIQAGLVEGLRP